MTAINFISIIGFTLTEDFIMSVYKEKGFDNRDDYLEHLSVEYDVDLDLVDNLANLLGETEDFDGLITSLEDLSGILGTDY